MKSLAAILMIGVLLLSSSNSFACGETEPDESGLGQLMGINMTCASADRSNLRIAFTSSQSACLESQNVEIFANAGLVASYKIGWQFEEAEEQEFREDPLTWKGNGRDVEIRLASPFVRHVVDMKLVETGRTHVNNPRFEDDAWPLRTFAGRMRIRGNQQETTHDVVCKEQLND